MEFEKRGHFKVAKDITEDQINQLIFYTTSDIQIQKFTQDLNRFKDRTFFDQWRQKGRSIYVLEDFNQNLSGIIWFGQKKLPDVNFILDLQPDYFNTTFSIRLYENSRRKNQAFPFMSEAFILYRDSQYYDGKGFWLETAVDNIPALNLYQKFGFLKVTEPDVNRRIFMVLN